MSLFIDDKSRVDKEAVREYVFNSLIKFRQRANALVHGMEHETFWNELHNAISGLQDKDKETLRQVENQLRGLPQYIDGWEQMSVDSPERFEFFILTKAKEISSGDTQKDYFWALQIRHDQLVGLVRVLEALLPKLEQWVDMEADEVLQDEVFLGMGEKGVEEQVFMEAEKVHEEREEMRG